MQESKSKKFLNIFILFSLVIVFLFTKDKLILFLLSLIVFVYGLRYFAERNPQAEWVKFAFGFYGPRTDTKYMTKNELYKSGAQFLVYAFYFSIMFLIVTSKLSKVKTESSALLLALFFAIFLIFIMFLGGGLYLLFLGVIRKKDYMPQYGKRDVP